MEFHTHHNNQKPHKYEIALLLHQYDEGVAVELSVCGVYSLIYVVVSLILLQTEYKGLVLFVHVDLSHC